MIGINATHDAARRSWVASANEAGCDFPIQNLPFGMFTLATEPDGATPRPGVAIGDQVVDLRALDAASLLQGDAARAVRAVAPGQAGLNAMMALGHRPASALREQLSDLLREGGSTGLREGAGLLHPQAAVQMHMPCQIGDYTDFLTSYPHTERHGKFKGLAVPVTPVFHSLPVAYHGRASSIRVAGTPVRRPNGQWKAADDSVHFGAVEAMDFELELAAIVGAGTALGQPVSLDEAPDHIFGYVLLNDWSAKSVQWWEQMLGPFLGKSFMSSISPWVITAQALAPFATRAPARRPDSPPLLAYLNAARDRTHGGLDIAMEAWLSTSAMREAGAGPQRLCATHLSHLSWTFGQMLTHHCSNGCDLRPGDLMGSGTVSGERPDERACMTEITSAGREPLRLQNGEERRWLHDGDEVSFHARASVDGRVPIGFGPCSARVLPAVPYPLPQG
ncbi:fumarylacetoacetase [Hydrogenophaga sp.]|uniref:fumarylacetoacetase n=1 Tax=Hydrogenophaga sp. TaxID=1904254 RepID=UPI002FCA1032